MIHLRLTDCQAFIWLCPECASTWAILDNPVHDWISRGRTVHEFLRLECQECGGGLLTAGSWASGLTDEDFDNLLSVLPYDQLIREFRLYMEQLDERDTTTPRDFDTATCTITTRFVHLEGSEGPP